MDHSLEIEAQEGLFLLRIWHEDRDEPIWAYSIARIATDDTILGRAVPGINAVAAQLHRDA